MNLREHLEVLAMKPNMLAFHTKLDKAVIDRALAGQPITAAHAESIVSSLNKAHGLHLDKKGRLDVADIDDLQVLSHADLKGRSNAV